MHCKYLSVAPYKALEKFSKALYGTTGGTYSARVFRPVMPVVHSYQLEDLIWIHFNMQAFVATVRLVL